MTMVAVSSSGQLDTAALERALTKANRDVGRRLATDVRTAQTQAAKAVRGSLTMSGMRVQLAVKTKVFAGAQTVTVDVQASPAGPWSIVESGHKGSTVKPRRKRAVTTPKGPRAHAHPHGAGGRRVWSRATEQATPKVEQLIVETFDRTLGQAVR